MDEDLLDEALEKTRILLDWRDSQPYDGVLGKIENWWTDEIKDEFYRVRNRLLNAMDYKEHVKVKKIRQWLDEYSAIQNLQESEVFCRSRTIPPEYWREVSYLAVLKVANSLKEDDGLRMVAGEMTADRASYIKQQSERAKLPRKLNVEQKESIRKRYTLAQQEGSKYGIVKELAETYEVSTKQIHNIVKDLVKK